VPAAICLDVAPFGLSEDAAALAQPMAIAVHSMRRGRPTAGDDVVVLGAGGIGAFLTWALAEFGAHVIVCEPNGDRRAMAQNLGASEVVGLSNDVPIKEELRRRRVLPTVVYEVSGSESGLRTALDILEPGGRLVVVGLQGGPREVDVRSVTLLETEILGTNAHVFSVDMPEALRLLSLRKDTWSQVAPVALSLDQLVDEAITPMGDGTGSRIKTLIDPWAPNPRRTNMRDGGDTRATGRLP
jgi:(R,R)-butanediol dehydrogenase/meso-butanediol dehydrogenase/diacetyl reductase